MIMMEPWIKCLLDLDKFLIFLDLDKIPDLGLNELIIPLLLSTTSLLSILIAIEVDMSDDPVIIALEWMVWSSYLIGLSINQALPLIT